MPYASSVTRLVGSHSRRRVHTETFATSSLDVLMFQRAPECMEAPSMVRW
ncbi:hypothetical protein CERSUDRAFT_101432 [Gelatoporia subvermispora B]|uniref:Uncharacterized protein n=1 Tax=Ceriporiopsis subvermispora (strain B) TaxID=914234 RepID=M2P5A3_CERS8|nr:hypothetical protein CERSUDRAFT_101432 [Gelatoporia subvermispora B]